MTGLAIFIKKIVESIKNSVTINLPNVSNSHFYKSIYNKVFETTNKFEESINEKKEKALAFAEKVEVEIQ